MFTYFIYITVLTLSCSFAYLAEKGNTASFRLCSRIALFLTLFIPASIRYGVGADYYNYIGIFRNIDAAPQEIGWIALNKLISLLGLSEQFVFVFSAFLIYFPICFVIKRKDIFLAVLFYIVLLFYFKSYNTLRQAIAVSFIICSVTNFEEKNILKTIFWLVLACMFHISAVLMFPLLILQSIRIKRRSLLIILTLLGVLFIVRYNVLTIALSLAEKAGFRYARYANTLYAEKTTLGTGIGVLLRLVLPLLTIFMGSSITKRDTSKTLMVNLSLVYVFSYILAAQFIILGRIRDLFVFVPILIISSTISAAGKYKKVIALCLIILNTFLFLYDIKYQTWDRFSTRVNPYQTIFSKEKW